MVDWLFGSERIDFTVTNEPDNRVADSEDEHDDTDNPADGRIKAEPADHLVDGEQSKEHAEPNESLRVEQSFPVRRFREVGAPLIDEVGAERE